MSESDESQTGVQTKKSDKPTYTSWPRCHKASLTRELSSEVPKIPVGLNRQELSVYQDLLNVRNQRIINKQAPPNVVVITDLAKDYDDVAAMVLLKELHRLGLIKLEGFIANLMPAKLRARFGRGALDSLGMQDIPIAWGEEASDVDHEQLPYEFNCDFMDDDAVITQSHCQDEEDGPGIVNIESGVSLLDRLILNTGRTENSLQMPDGISESKPRETRPENKLTFLLISSLSDIFTYSQREPQLLARSTSKVILQGGYSMQKDETSDSFLRPDPTAANNRFDMRSASGFHTYMEENHIPSVVYTKVCAAAAHLPIHIFEELEATEHPLGVHLRKVQVEQDLIFYEGACVADPASRFAPHFDQEYFLTLKTNWFEQGYPPGTPGPIGREVLPYLTKIIVYDALAALGTAGPDVLSTLGVLKPFQGSHLHKIVGVEATETQPKDSGINEIEMKKAITALLKGSLMACQQRISSMHNSGQQTTK